MIVDSIFSYISLPIWQFLKIAGGLSTSMASVLAQTKTLQLCPSLCLLFVPFIPQIEFLSEQPPLALYLG